MILNDLNKIKNTASTDISINSDFTTTNLELITTGSGSIKANYNLIINQQLNSQIIGIGSINLQEGSTLNQTVNIQGNGNYNAFDLQSSNATVNNYGSSQARIRVSDQLDASIFGSGNIYYKDNPNITSSIFGIGQIIDAN